MDEYGCYLANNKDWDELARLFSEKENILFSYSKFKMSCMIISINREFNIHGTVSIGGKPHGHAIVSVLKYGSHHTDIDSKQYPDYLEVHLKLPKSEAETLAELLNKLRLRRQ